MIRLEFHISNASDARTAVAAVVGVARALGVDVPLLDLPLPVTIPPAEDTAQDTGALSAADAVAAPATRTRRTRKPDAPTSPDPVDAYNAIAGAAGKPTVPDAENVAVDPEPTREYTAEEIAEAIRDGALEPSPEAVKMVEDAGLAAEPQTEPEPEQPADTRTRDDMLAELRAIAHSRGAIWLRDNVLVANKASRLSDLSDDALRAGVAAGNAA